MASLGRAVSGLQAAQRGLAVTSHNLSNVNTTGYTRQQLLQADSRYVNVSSSPTQVLQVGMGVDMTGIRQIRDEFADRRYRTENSILNYYSVLQSGVNEIETILDEPYGESISSILEEFWNQTQKLSLNPNGVEERLAFLQTAKVFVERANNISSSLEEYQLHLNEQVKSTVSSINSILQDIKSLNHDIAYYEINGDRANDLRDQRNVLLDELSSYVDIDYEEETNGMIRLKIEGQLAIDGPFVRELEVAQTEAKSPLVEPVWKDTKTALYPLNREINTMLENDRGYLKSLLITRGRAKANADTEWSDIALNDLKSVDYSGNEYLIPRLQKELDTLFREITCLVNDVLDGEGIGTQSGVSGIPVFVPVRSVIEGETLPTQPVLGDNPTEEEIEAYRVAIQNYNEAIKPHLVSGNLQVNPYLLENGGYNKLGTVSATQDVGDNSKVVELLNSWGEDRVWNDNKEKGDPDYDPTAPTTQYADIFSYYANIVSSLGSRGSDYTERVSEKNVLVTNTNNDRQSISAVSTDEEFTYMLRYQHAYNASARMVNVLDDMLDTIINRM
jgi:flagellar hook-associated protein 1 FlgK